MQQSLDRITKDIPCLSTDTIATTLVSTAGHHCDVWQSIGVLVRDGERVPLDFVIKVHCGPCSLAETRVYQRQYQVLKNALGSIIPAARFVATKVDGVVSLVAVLGACAGSINFESEVGQGTTVIMVIPKDKRRSIRVRRL